MHLKRFLKKELKYDFRGPFLYTFFKTGIDKLDGMVNDISMS